MEIRRTRKVAVAIMLTFTLLGGTTLASTANVSAAKATTSASVSHSASAQRITVGPSPRVSSHVQSFAPRPRFQKGISYDRGGHIWIKLTRAEVLSGLGAAACWAAAAAATVYLPGIGGYLVKNITCQLVNLAVKAIAARYVSGGYWAAVWPNGYYEYGTY
jgi:hypothetical protein